MHTTVTDTNNDKVDTTVTETKHRYNLRRGNIIELVGIECALGHVTGVYFYKHFALINTPYWIYLYCSRRIIQ